MSDESRDSSEAGRKGSGKNDNVINHAATAAATAVSNTLIPKFTEITTALEGLRLSAISRDEAMTLIGQAEQRVEVRLDQVEMIVEEERVLALLEWVEKEKSLDYAKRGTVMVRHLPFSLCFTRDDLKAAESLGALIEGEWKRQRKFPQELYPYSLLRRCLSMLGGISSGEPDIDGSWGMSWRIESFFYRSSTDMRGEPSHTGELKLSLGDVAALLSAYDEARNRLGIEEGRPFPLSLPTDTEILNRKIVMHPGASPLFRFFGKVDRATRAVEGGFATEAQQNLKDRYHVVVQDFRKVTGPTSTRAAGLTE
eukprot:Cvel_7784.t1-p1 / transcript=Cvel_7784.t1 / gene=Cvel_7784 / organism=Chromera_velia_CCMP2878 / gene_product=hypothetical protein / transcript_product=hypothetical protein / location=Cvel_scaffold415:1-931(-) / protein_length=310 / sequence_SO=supercontig / SO=protein_coding / is_pseudo=false